MDFSEESSSSDEGSNDESVESLMSISSTALQRSFFDQAEDETDPFTAFSTKECRTVRTKSRASFVRSRSSRLTETASRRRSFEHKNNFILPIFRIPSYQAGIMWTGNLRRTPVFIFSQNCTIKRSDWAEKLGRMFNMTFRLIRAECRLLRSVLQSHGFQESFNHLGRFNLLWTGSHLKPCQLRLLTDFHKVNHFPRSYELTRKDRLAKNVQRMQQIKGLRHFDFVPQTYILPEEYREFCSNFEQNKGPYIVKPIASSRGRGIHIISHPDDIPYEEPVIVSRYISNPFLLDGFKFDVRIYAAVTSYDPLVVYIYEEGLVRFATVRYQPGARHLKTQCMHLTNYSVNKKNFEFVHNDDANVEDFGNKWSLGALLRFLQSEGADVTGLMVRIEEIIIKSFLCVVNPIASACAMFQACRSKCFELYGFDIIVDEEFRPWLLEVNLSPSLACDSPLDFKVKSHMITDLLNLVGIVCHDPTRKTQGGMNSLHMKADGQAAVPPKLPTYFVSAEEQVNGRANLVQRQHQTLRSDTCCSISDGCPIGLAGVPSSHLLPKGVTPEETRLMRRIQEESARAGGWIRLIPHPEIWEQYACIWPNDITPWYVGNDRRFFSTSTDGSRTSLIDTGHTERRFSPNSLLASAFMASLAVSTLHSLVATVHSHEASDSSDSDSNADSDSWSQSSVQLNLTPKVQPKARISCAAQPKFLHPNSSNINIDLVAYIHRTTSRHTSGDYQSTLIYNSRVPSINAVTRPRFPLHNMPYDQMQECLHSLFNPEPCSATIPHEQCQRVLFCYAHTLSHMPFFLRKLGESPTNLPGVCLRPGCRHDRSRNTTPCGIYQATRIPEADAPCRTDYPRSVVSSTNTVLMAPSPCEEVSKEPIQPVRSDYTRKRRMTSDFSTNTDHKSGLLDPDAAKLSASQARHAFAAYLARIQSRMLFEAKQPITQVGLNKTALKKEHKQVDLMVRFLKRASEHLSLQAIATICCKDSINECAGDVRKLFQIAVPDQTKPLVERKRALARLLDRFIQIYQYETVAILSDQFTKQNKSVKSVESSRFQKFLQSATETQLEVLLSKYTRLHHSVDVFMGRTLDRLSIAGDSRYPDDQSNRKRSRSRSVEPALPNTSIINSSSSDSGFASFGDTGSGHESSTSLVQQSSVHSARSDCTIGGQRQDASSRSNTGSSPKVSDMNDSRSLTWSNCCLTLRRRSSEKSAASDCFDNERPIDSAIQAKSQPLVISIPGKKQLKADKKKSSEKLKPHTPTNTLKSSKGSLSQSKHKMGLLYARDNDAMEAGVGVSQSQPHIHTTNSSSQTNRASVSLRMCRPRQVGRNRIFRAISPTVNYPLMYSTRRRPQTAGARVHVGSHIKPRNTYRDPRMIPICSIKSIRPSKPVNNHNSQWIDKEQSPRSVDVTFSRKPVTSKQDFFNKPYESSFSQPHAWTRQEKTPGAYPALCVPFNAPLYRIQSQPQSLQDVMGDYDVGQHPLVYGTGETERNVYNKTLQSLPTVSNFTGTHFMRTPSLRRVHPSL